MSGSTSSRSAFDDDRLPSQCEDSPSLARPLTKQSIVLARTHFEDDAAEKEALLKARLLEGRQQLEMLRRWGFPAEVLARAAAGLLDGAGAASGVSRAVAAGKGAAMSVGTTHASASLAGGRNAVSDDGDASIGRDRVATVPLPAAARETIRLREQGGARPPAADPDATARQIKALLDDALRDLRI